jgi:predicted anti-sigma-YlaC factor YlaD
MLNCRAATQLLSEALDRELSLADRMNLKMHVMMCSGCRNFGQQMKVLRAASDHYAGGQAPAQEEQTSTGGSNA